MTRPTLSSILSLSAVLTLSALFTSCEMDEDGIGPDPEQAAQEVSLAQEDAAADQPCSGCKEEGAQGHEHPGHHNDVLFSEGVQRAAANLPNGASISYTSEDGEQVAALQQAVHAMLDGGTEGSHCTSDCPCKQPGVEKSVEDLSNGVKLTLTAADEATVALLQEHVAKKAAQEGCGCKGEASTQPGAILHGEGVSRSVENLDNGVKVLFTASCPKMQAMIKTAGQEMVAKHSDPQAQPTAAHQNSPMFQDGVTVSAEDIEGGVAITFIASDPELVGQVQAHAAEMAKDAGHEQPEHTTGHGDCPHHKAAEQAE